MPYRPQHKETIRKQIVENARILFNRHGFTEVSIDQIMAEIGLTRGGFYNHFANKQQLYTEAVFSFLDGRGKTWREDAGIRSDKRDLENVLGMINSYLSDEHLGDIDGQCPMIALPSDVARASPDVKAAYQSLLNAMIWLFENNVSADAGKSRTLAITLAALCVGGMVLARTIDDSELRKEIQSTARDFALDAVQH